MILLFRWGWQHQALTTTCCSSVERIMTWEGGGVGCPHADGAPLTSYSTGIGWVKREMLILAGDSEDGTVTDTIDPSERDASPAAHPFDRLWQTISLSIGRKALPSLKSSLRDPVETMAIGSILLSMELRNCEIQKGQWALTCPKNNGVLPTRLRYGNGMTNPISP